jgi:predicted amidohydrolase YtcJ
VVEHGRILAMILENGTIRTLDPSLPVAGALAIAGDRVAGGVGTHETALASPETVDLGGRCVLPGFTDSHVHFVAWALAQHEVRFEGTRSLDEAVERVRDAVSSIPPGGWLRGRGWRSGDWTPAVEPTRQVLDAVTGDVPTALTARDGHSMWLNSAALAHADGDLRVDGGVVEVDESGQPTGVLREESAWLFRERFVEASYSEAECMAGVREGLKLAATRGVTAIHAAVTNEDRWLGGLPFFEQLDADDALTLRVWQWIPHQYVSEVTALRLRSRFGSDRLRLGALKAFMDGTLGSETALLLDGTGVRITSREELEELIRRGAETGFAVAVHAIGDRANRDALDALEATRDLWQPRGLRPRIEHAQCLAPEDVGRFAQLGIAASVQFVHATSDQDLAERIWADRVDRAYLFRSLADSGAVVANGSDAPVEELDPLTGIRAGVLRTTDERPPWRLEQALTLDQALHATCVAPAWLTHEERRRGKLLPGYLADLVVLSTDPHEDLEGCEVVATMVGGRWVYNPPPWD